MGDWPLKINPNVAVGTSTTTVTSGTPAHTKGSWAEITSGFDVDITGLMATFNLSNNGDYLYDIGIGDAGSEVVLVSNILCTEMDHVNQVDTMTFPGLSIPAGTRISMRAQSNSTSKSNNCQIHGFPSSHTQVQGGVATLGADTSDSGAVAVDSGGTADTKGSWSEISSATPYSAMSFIIAFGLRRNNALSGGYFNFDVGLGAAGSEVVIVPDLRVMTRVTTDVLHPRYHHIPVAIPEGQRVAVRSASSITNATDRLVDAAIYLNY